MSMQPFYVIATVRNQNYLTQVYSETNGGAEHKVLDLGVCGRREYSVRSAQAFDGEAMKTDTFIGMALDASPIRFEDLAQIIAVENDRIIKKDECAGKIERMTAEIEQLTKELEDAKRVFATL